MTATETLPPWAAEPMTEAELDSRVEAMEVADEAEDETHRPWRIGSNGEAEWAMAHIAAIDAQLLAIHDQEVAWRKQLEIWLADAIRKPMARRFFFTGALVDYQRRCREADPRAKSLALPSGKLTSRITPARPVVVDEDAVLSWARRSSREDLIEVKERVRLADLRKALQLAGDRVVDPATGEQVPGIEVEPESLSINVVPAATS